VGSYQVVLSIADAPVNTNTIDPPRRTLGSTAGCNCERVVFNYAISQGFGTIYNSTLAIAVLGPLAIFGAVLGLTYRSKKKSGNAGKKCQSPCGTCRTCDGGRCTPKPNGTSCGETGTCQRGTCKCPEGKKYCVNGAACAECCIDDDCPRECSWCSGYPYGTCSEARKDVCQGDPACVKPLCEDRYTHRAWVCRNTCCDEFAGEETCGTVCCNALVGETCCDSAFCCTPDEDCIAGKCLQKCADGRQRCGGVCCTDTQECDTQQTCVEKQCTDAPPCPDCYDAKCINPGGPPGTQWYCDPKCTDRYAPVCVDGACKACRPDKSPCYDSRVDLYACCTSQETCTTGCACCIQGTICCPSGDCCRPGHCAPGGGCYM
jgi:hypothetical protein